MLTLECPHCQSCFTTEEWNEQPKNGSDIPKGIEDSDGFDEWNIKEGGSMIDCPECGDVALTEDMTVV